MASRRPGAQTFGWPGHARPRDPRAGPEISREEAKLNTKWTATRAAEPSHQQPLKAIPQPTLSSRLPPPLAHRRPSDSQAEQPRFVQQPRTRTSIGSASGLMFGRGDAAPSASATSKLPAPSLKPRNTLRRKRSGLSQDTSSTRIDSRNDSTGTTSSDSYHRSPTPLDPLHLDRELTRSPMEIRVAQQIEIPMTKAQTVTIYPELDRYRDVQVPHRAESPSANLPHRIATHDLPPPTPLFSGTSSQISAFSGSPSTRWSGSPGPGPYSRDTTPTSISSQSPGLVAPIRIPPPGTRIRQVDHSLPRPAFPKRRAGSLSNEAGADPQGLAVVKELSTSSSSNSTVRAGVSTKEKKKGNGSSQRPPSPPPRKSSQKPTESRDEVIPGPHVSRKATQSQVAAPPTVKPTSYSRPRPVQPTHPAASPKATPPARPSRDGTADLQVQFGHSIPVIQSNLSSTSLPERRQSGLLAPGPASRLAASTAPTERPNHLSRRPPTREPSPAAHPSAPDNVTSPSKQEPARHIRTPSPIVSTSTFKTRFPIFGRRTKTIPEPAQQEKKDKPSRKGPAAGTGHEGYGKLGSVRRRSNSVTSTTRVIPGTMSSQESLGSLSHDSFLMERMAPVIIAGGEVVENRNTSSELTRTESNQSSTFRRPSIESRNSSQVSLSSREVPRKRLWPSPFPRGATQAPPLSSRRPSESSDSEALTMKPTLALRRSLQRLKSGEQEPPRLPKPIVTRAQVVSPSMTSLDASILSDDSIFDPSAEPAVATKEPAPTVTVSGPKKLIRRARSPRKWNFFGRSQSQAPAEKKMETAKTVAATVQVVPTKPVAFYTMMDSSEQEDADPVDLEEVLREARGIAITTPEVPQEEERDYRRPSVTEQAANLQQVDCQPPANLKRASTVPIGLPATSASETKQKPAPTQQPATQPPTRPSRLPQVGRIPKVVSARAEQISPKSFSRPFHRLSVQMPPPRPDLQDEASVAKGPSPPQPSSPEPAYEESLPLNDSNLSALIYGVPRLLPPTSNQPGQEFLAFSPRKNSQCTTTTCSSSSGGLLSYADATAIVPSPSAPLSEDEIWDEYNDLLGDDTIKLPTSEGPAWPKPLRLEGASNGHWIEPALESPTLSPPPLPSLVQALRSGMEHASLSVRGSDIALEVKRMLDCDPTPENSVVMLDRPCSQESQVQAPETDKRTEEPASAQRDSASSALQVRRSNASSSTQCSEDSSPVSQVNLRVGSMTVSKWLTFGHVLFSPVRDELVSDVGSLKRPSILVVDGLGNDDWSFYAAETYPAATFFNLSPRAPLPAEHRNESSFPLRPPNHHQVQYLSHTAKFPFGAQSFIAVVFRFPAAAPEGHYRNIISEARRVLKPGGYLELSILDVDLNNMGNRCRRAVRRVKERIHANAPNTSLASMSDLMLRLIGRRGFTDIKTCRVGVPVASTIARSSSGGSKASKRSSTGGAAREKLKPKKDERSLPEMINDEGPVADESIAQSVAKVGRWWYSRCYESAAAPGTSGPLSRGSIWRDKALLAECEEWGTSLKLMVCHARVPDGRARVASI